MLTVFSVTTENFIGTIKDAPPPMEIPWTRATWQVQKNNKTILNVAYLTMLWWRNQIRELPGASYRCECGSKANTFYRPPQDRNPLCNERATSNEILETLDFKGNEIFLRKYNSLDSRPS